MQEIKAETIKKHILTAGYPCLLGCISHRGQAHQPRESTTHNGLGPPLLINT